MSLFSLPTEIITLVVEQLEIGPDKDTLRALARTCQALKSIAERHLYSSAVFTTHAQLHLLRKALQAQPERSAYIRHLELPWSTDKFDYGCNFNPLELGHLANLNSFLSESPFCNGHWDGEFDVSEADEGWSRVVRLFLDTFEQASLLTDPGPGRERPLGNLRHLTLHWTGSSYKRCWDVTPFCPIFLLPALDSLEVSCLRMNPPGEGWDDGLAGLSRQTNLKSLILTRCSIWAAFLVPILSFPRALETLGILDPRADFINNWSPRYIIDDVETFNIAIAQQAESLRRLEICRDYSYTHTDNRGVSMALDLSGFRSLSQLHLSPNNRKYGRATWALSGSPPPALRTLRLTEFRKTTERGLEYPREVCSSLQIDQLIANADRRGVPFELDISSNTVGTTYTRAKAYLFEIFLPLLAPRSGAPGPQHRLRMLRPKHFTRYIPPYLHGKKRPYHKVRYDSLHPEDEVEEFANDEAYPPENIYFSLHAREPGT